MANNKNITFNQLEASMTKVKAEIDKKANTNHGTHVPTTGTANNATYLRNDNQWHKIVPSDIGAAPVSHGDHVTYSKTSPSAPGTASAGSAANVSRGDHVHPLQTSVSGSSGSCTGNAATATKLKTARNIALTGTITGNANFDGSGNISIATSVNSVPASGNWFKGIPTVTSAGVMEVGKYIDFHNAADGTTDYDVRLQCNGTSANTVNMPTNSGTLALLSDNVASATKLQTARKIGKASFNGTANIALSDIMGRATTSTSGNNNKNKYTKFARIDISSGAYTGCCGKLSIVSSESNHLQGILDYYFRTNDTISNVTIGLYWTSLSASGYSNTVYAVKVSNGVYDLYYKPLTDWDTTTITNIDCTDSNKITFYSSQSFVSSITAIAASSLYSYSSACSGNANTATTLKTARTINGTSFNGSANITTANWGTARTLTIGNSGKSVNGSGNVSWTLDEIGAASSGHTHNKILDGNSNITITQTNDRSGLDGKNNIDLSSWYGVSISNGCSNNNNYGQVTFSVDARNGNVWARGTVKAPTFSGSLSGNASSATKLQTARAIKIGNTSRNFDGTGNVTWTLSDIGAAASNHSHNNYAASSHEHNYLNVKGTNTINSTANDTTAKWGAQGNSVHWYTEANKINGQPSQWGYLVNIGQSSEVHQIWMEQANGNLSHRGGNNSGWGGSWKTILDSSNYSNYAAAKSHTHNYAAANHTHNYAASNHNHDSAYLKLSGGTLSGQLTVNSNVSSQGFCVSKNSKEVWLDIGDNDTYIWASGANKSLQITHGGDLNFDGKPVIYGGRGNNFNTAVGSIYFKNSANTYAARISSYHNNDIDQDYAHMGIRDANDNMPNYINLYPDTVRIKSNNIELGGKRLTIATSAPSNPSNGDVWINIG